MANTDASVLKNMHRYWQAANYLTVGQIYRLANPLLREPLRPEHIKPRLLGHWGTSPGLSFVYVHLNRLIRDVPKPVIAAVNGLAIGGGHVFHVLCDLSIAAEHARFGQAGPRVGSFDGGFGSAYLARVVGEKRAREIWFLLDQYSATDAERWGLVNRVVPADQLMGMAREWGRTMARYSPTALRFLKHSFNADTDHQGGLSLLSEDGLDVFLQTDEAKEGAAAFAEKREPDFAKYHRSH